MNMQRWDTTPDYEASITHDLLVRGLARISILGRSALVQLRRNFNPYLLGINENSSEENLAVLAIMNFIDSEIASRDDEE